MSTPVAPTGGIQLLPQTRKKIDVVVPGQTRNLVLSFFILILVGVGYFLLLNYRNGLFKQVDDLNAQIKQIDDSRDISKEAELLQLAKQLVGINTLVSNHVTWSQAFAKFHKLILPQVTLRSLSASVDRKKFSISGTTDNYASVARQVAAFYADPDIVDIDVGQVSVQTSGRVDFSMEIEFKPNQYLRKAGDGASTAIKQQ